MKAAKKLGEIAFIGAASYVSGLLYEQGRKGGRDVSKLSPKAFTSNVGSARVRKLISDLIGKVAKVKAEQEK